MMYWIVFAFFSCIETFTDIFLAWFPFYYEVKVIIVLWLLSPATKGSSTLYRKFVHPMLTRREDVRNIFRKLAGSVLIQFCICRKLTSTSIKPKRKVTLLSYS